MDALFLILINSYQIRYSWISRLYSEILFGEFFIIFKVNVGPSKLLLRLTARKSKAAMRSPGFIYGRSNRAGQESERGGP